MASNENTPDYTRLVELSGSDFEIVDEQPNVIGWNVRNVEGYKIGEVDDLLFNPDSRRVRYLVVDMEDNDLDLEVERRVLIPIGIAELHEANDDVIIPDITVEQLSDLPPYEFETLNADTERTIRDVFDGNKNPTQSTGVYNTNEFYTHNYFDDTKFYASRNVKIYSSKEPAAEETTTPSDMPRLNPAENTKDNNDVLNSHVISENNSAHSDLDNEDGLYYEDDGITPKNT